MAKDEQQIAYFFIGYNGNKEFGFKEVKKDQYMKCPNESISRVFSSDEYSIYANDNYQQLFASGRNGSGQCGIGSTESQIQGHQPITYFQKNGMKLNNICTNVLGECTFFISEKGELYGCGSNTDGRYGINEKNMNQYEPKLIPGLSNVIDAQTSNYCTVVLCATDDRSILSILSNWCRLYDIPQDIMDLLMTFCKVIYSVFNNK